MSMEIFTNDSKVLVKKGNKDFEFERGRNEKRLVKYVGDEGLPQEIIDHLEEQDFEVFIEPEVYELRLPGPYAVNEASSVFGIDIQRQKYDKFKSIVDYGIQVELEVKPDGKTQVVSIQGTELETPVEL